MTRFEEAMEAAVRWKNNPQERDKLLLRLTTEEHFPVYLSVLVEYRDDLMKSTSDYHRSKDDRELDAGGLATTLKMIDDFMGLMLPPEKEPEPKQE